MIYGVVIPCYMTWALVASGINLSPGINVLNLDESACNTKDRLYDRLLVRAVQFIFGVDKGSFILQSRPCDGGPFKQGRIPSRKYQPFQTK